MDAAMALIAGSQLLTPMPAAPDEDVILIPDEEPAPPPQVSPAPPP
jgi:hypothetical protein